MNLDTLKAQWADHDQKLDTYIQLNTKLLRELNIGKARSALQKLSRNVFEELVFDLIVVIALGVFMADHFSQWAFLAPAVLLQVFAVAQVVFDIYQLATVQALDWNEPVLASQKKLAALRLKRIRFTQWTLLLVPLLWVPLLSVALKGLLGVNAYAVFDTTWLVVNVLFGIAFIPLMLWLSKRFATRMNRSPLVQRVMDDIAGNNLKEATGFLDELASFER